MKTKLTNSIHVGRAGELRVASELLLRGLNTTLNIVDTGVDLFVEGCVKVQVKTATAACGQDKKWTYSFLLGRERSASIQQPDFTICWAVNHNWFFVFPSRWISFRKNIALTKQHLWHVLQVSRPMGRCCGFRATANQCAKYV